MNDLAGRRSRPWFVRRKVVEVVAPIAAAISEAMGQQPLLCPESARVLLNGHSYDGAKATRELGLEYTPLRETVARTLDWFRRHEG